jgi:hypothetical protein
MYSFFVIDFFGIDDLPLQRGRNNTRRQLSSTEKLEARNRRSQFEYAVNQNRDWLPA